jgi:hypothetical protein
MLAILQRKVQRKDFQYKTKVVSHLKCNRLLRNGSMAKLANASVIHPADPSSNIGIERKYFLILFMLQLNLNLCGFNS